MKDIVRKILRAVMDFFFIRIDRRMVLQKRLAKLVSMEIHLAREQLSVDRECDTHLIETEGALRFKKKDFCVRCAEERFRELQRTSEQLREMGKRVERSRKDVLEELHQLSLCTCCPH